MYKSRLFLPLFLLVLLLLPQLVQAQGGALPKLVLSVENASGEQDYVLILQILFLMTILTLAPAILIMMTSFTRIIVVLHFIRQALGTQQLPPNQLLIGLSLFLTFYIMQPTFEQVNDEALQPFLAKEITQQEALTKAGDYFKGFMLRQARDKDVALFVRLANLQPPANDSELPLTVVIPGFVISELRIAFQIGFLVYLPLLIIDMVVASILMSMGMLMLPPIMISLPFKILLFVLVDGWNLLIYSVVAGFN
ncbi:MAG: flagellar type III secretion system pore protein FliP [Candidatus Delongbacteria bacterium]|nr:flagellar type III secretion system pore protein FliP [Candidatus Delongbacteria bacterium]